MNVSILTPNILKNLSNLHTFIIDGLPITSFDTRVLLDVNKTLMHLEINSNPNNKMILFNVTGDTALLSKLETLSMRNCFIETIFNNSLLGVSIIKNFEFTNNQLKSIEINAFQSIQNSIQFIDLRNNYLTTIDCIFDELIHINNNNNMVIHIGDNPWNCYPIDDSLSNLLQNYSKIFVDPICQIDLLPVDCQNDQGKNEMLNINVNEMPFNIEFMENENVLHVQFKQEQYTSNYVLFWYHTIVESVINCAQSTFGTYFLDNLIDDTVYTLCSMNKFKTSLSPLDCTAYYHKGNPKDYNPWLLLKYKQQYIAIYLVVCLILIAFGFGIMYCVVLMFPVKFLQGASGVIVVKNRSDFIGQDEGSKYEISYLEQFIFV